MYNEAAYSALRLLQIANQRPPLLRPDFIFTTTKAPESSNSELTWISQSCSRYSSQQFWLVRQLVQLRPLTGLRTALSRRPLTSSQASAMAPPFPRQPRALMEKSQRHITATAVVGNFRSNLRPRHTRVTMTGSTLSELPVNTRTVSISHASQLLSPPTWPVAISSNGTTTTTTTTGASCESF